MMKKVLSIMAVVFSAVTAAFLLGAWAVKFVNIKLPAEKKVFPWLEAFKK